MGDYVKAAYSDADVNRGDQGPGTGDPLMDPEYKEQSRRYNQGPEVRKQEALDAQTPQAEMEDTSPLQDDYDNMIDYLKERDKYLADPS